MADQDVCKRAKQSAACRRWHISRLLLFALIMFGFCYSLVPLYNTFCQVTGLLGKGSRQRATYVNDTPVDLTRTITVQFIAHVKSDMPWEFTPGVKKIALHPGELKEVRFHASNLSNHTIIGQAIPSISPGNAAKYLKKTQCFCFTQQKLKAHQQAEMPVVFFLDKALPKEIHVLTLSYTLFDTQQQS